MRKHLYSGMALGVLFSGQALANEKLTLVLDWYINPDHAPIVVAEQIGAALSGGQRQRAFLALLLAQDTPLVLLDEPTTWLDIHHQVALMTLMRELQTMGKTVVTVLHDLNQASRYCDHLVVLEGGRVQAQGLAETVLTPEMLREIFHLEAEIHPEPVSQRPMCVVK